MKTLRPARAFTLIELLVVMGVIAIVAAFLMTAMGGVRRSANRTKEVSAARQLMVAFHRYTGENDGQILPGYGAFPATDELGAELHNPVANRYPWRLAPYLGYDMRVLWGNNDDDELRKLAAGPRDAYIYGVSVQPSLGMNTIFVGGDYQAMPPNKPKAIELYGNFCITRISQATNPTNLIVFASAGAGYEKQRLTGYFKVEPPNVTGRRWPGAYSPRQKPESCGYVDFRFDEKAVVAMLDGHVDVLSFSELDDMRRWSNQAAELNDPSWTLGKR